MNGFLLDTNCISELVRARPEPRVVEWMESADESSLYLSVLTLGENPQGRGGSPTEQAAGSLGSMAGDRPANSLLGQDIVD